MSMFTTVRCSEGAGRAWWWGSVGQEPSLTVSSGAAWSAGTGSPGSC